MSVFEEGKDYYYDEQGLIVLTAAYHLKRGNCCGRGCLHCPYNYEAVAEPKRSLLRENKLSNKNDRDIETN